MSFFDIATPFTQLVGNVSQIVFGIPVMIAQKDQAEDMSKFYREKTTTERLQQKILSEQYEQKKELEKTGGLTEYEIEVTKAYGRFINNAYTQDDLDLLAVAMVGKIPNLYIDDKTGHAILAVSSQENDTELEQRAISYIQSKNDVDYTLLGDVDYTLLGLGALALILLFRRK